MAKRLLTTVEAAAFLRLKPQTLRAWRHYKIVDQPRPIRLGRRAIRYETTELEAWLDRRRQSTS